MSDDPRRANYIEGLQTERAMYAASGRADRVAQVDAELKRLGVTRATTKRGVERAVQPKRETR